MATYPKGPIAGSQGGPDQTAINNWPDVQPVNDNGGSITVDGSVAVSNLPVTQPVSGTFFQATQPVSGSVSVSNLPATQTVTGTVTSNDRPFTPATADILSGGTRVNNSVTSTAFLTVPAGRTWFGTVNSSCAATTVASTVVDARVVTVGTNVVPAAGTVLSLALCSGVSGNGTASAGPSPCYVTAPVGNSVTLNLLLSSATTTSGSATATGVLL